MQELQRFRRALLYALSQAQEIHVTTQGGMDITLFPRHWHATDGEVFTAPAEDKTNGTIWVDGCAYAGPPQVPFLLQIQDGKGINLDELGESDEQ